MKLSVMLFPFHGPMVDGRLTVEEIVDTFVAEGVGGIEPMQSRVVGAPDLWNRFHKAAVAAGLCFPCHDVNVNLVRSGSEADLDAGLETAGQGVAFCRDAIDCPLAMLAGTAPAPNLDISESRRRYAAQLATVIERNRDTGVGIAVEDYGVYPLFTASAVHCREVLEAPGCEELGFVFDNGNFLLADDLPIDVLPDFMGRIVHVHIKDFALREPDDRPGLTSPSGRQYKGAMLGEGEAQVADVLHDLKAAGYPGWVSLEVSGAVGDPLEEAVHGIRFMRTALGER